MLDHFFYTASDPPATITGTYNYYLVSVSYLVASFASYVSLDIARNLRKDLYGIVPSKWWLLAGAFTLGAGIWTMHFIGMLAFEMPMTMNYDLLLTALSLLIAILASAIAFTLIMFKGGLSALIFGGTFIGIGIASMHYIGMAAMLDMTILYIPSLFFLSILIAILASQAALWFMLRTQTDNSRYRILLNIISALIMGAAISGMHYTGMEAAIFYVVDHPEPSDAIQPKILSFFLAAITILIMGIGLTLSTYQQFLIALQNKKNKELQTKEISLQKKQVELSDAVNKLKKLANELADKEERTRAVLTTAADAIMTINDKGTIQTSNPASEKMFGFTSEEMKKQSIQSMIKHKEEEISSPQAFLYELLRTAKTHPDLIGIRKDNSVFSLELAASRLNLSQGIHFVLILRDITERKQSEEELAALNKQLITMARRAGMVEVSSSVLHNVGNVLNSINVSATILKEKLMDSEMHNLADVARIFHDFQRNWKNFKENERGKDFVEYLTLLSKAWSDESTSLMQELETLIHKIQHIKHIVHMQQSLSGSGTMLDEVMMQDMIKDALAMNDLFNQRVFTVEIDCAVSTKITLDKVKLLQILVNLIKNAKESLMQSENPSKKIAIKSYFEGQDTIIIQVEDNGVGISSENLSKIFTFGFTTKKSGHGYGLHASAILAREMGATLSVQNKEGRAGAIFTLKMAHLQPNKEMHGHVSSTTRA